MYSIGSQYISYLAKHKHICCGNKQHTSTIINYTDCSLTLGIRSFSLQSLTYSQSRIGQLSVRISLITLSLLFKYPSTAVLHVSLLPNKLNSASLHDGIFLVLLLNGKMLSCKIKLCSQSFQIMKHTILLLLMNQRTYTS